MPSSFNKKTFDHILSIIVCTIYIENDAEIFPAHLTWVVAEKGFKMALVMINFCENILEKNFFFAKNHCEIQVHTILVCTLYSIKYCSC